jgi:uncharacterized protein with GYD domain
VSRASLHRKEASREEVGMPRYLVQFAYSSDAVSSMVASPQDRASAVRAMAENWGGTLEAFYFCFGEYDGLAVAEMPDNVTMAAVSMAVAASGAFKSFHTTVLLTPEEALEAMRRAGSLGYRPPGS